MKLKCNSCDGIYNNSLDVRFTKKCDNKCSFCIEQCGINALEECDIDKMIKSTIGSRKENILILGGEPFINVERLNKYVEGIRPYVKHIYITTSLPKTVDIHNKQVKNILDKIDGLNVSLQHYDYKINNNVLNAGSRHNRILQLAIILFDKEINKKVRVSINLVHGYIDNQEELFNFLNLMKNIGCSHVKINELQKVSKDKYVSFEEITNTKLKNPYTNGCQTDISNLFYFGGMKITLKRSCFVVKDKSIAKATVGNLFKIIAKNILNIKPHCQVLYENGQLSEGWRIKEGENNAI